MAGAGCSAAGVTTFALGAGSTLAVVYFGAGAGLATAAANGFAWVTLGCAAFDASLALAVAVRPPGMVNRAPIFSGACGSI